MIRTLVAFAAGLVAGYLLSQLLQAQRDRAELEHARAEAIRARSRLAEVRPAAPQQPDDLTRIHGIGPVFRQRLHESGILTFDQLAGTDPERLREIVAAADWQKVEPVRWIADARQLAAG